jgi:hypothetical protein
MFLPLNIFSIALHYTKKVLFCRFLHLFSLLLISCANSSSRRRLRFRLIAMGAREIDNRASIWNLFGRNFSLILLLRNAIALLIQKRGKFFLVLFLVLATLSRWQAKVLR